MIGELRGLRKTILPPLTGEAAKKFLTEGFYHFKQKRQRGNPLTLLPLLKRQPPAMPVDIKSSTYG